MLSLGESTPEASAQMLSVTLASDLKVANDRLAKIEEGAQKAIAICEDYVKVMTIDKELDKYQPGFWNGAELIIKHLKHNK